MSEKIEDKKKLWEKEKKKNMLYGDLTEEERKKERKKYKKIHLNE